MTRAELTDILYRHQDEKYGDFTAKLIPNIPRENFIGIRTPEYKKIVKEIGDDPVVTEFLAELPHRFHEENCLHSAFICRIKDFDECLKEVERFAPYIDNWAVNDGLDPKVFAKHHEELLPKVQEWIASEKPYVRRLGMHLLMSHFLGEDFRPEYLDLPADLRSGEYYVNMMTAWLFAEALVKQWEAALPYIENRRLDPWTLNKAIQKARESYRITEEQKEYLNSLKVKTGSKAEGRRQSGRFAQNTGSSGIQPFG